MIDELTLDEEAADEEAWEPTEADYDAFRRGKGWPNFCDIRYEHMSADERAIMEQAVKAARDYVAAIRQQPGRALILIASGVDDDTRRTGYGCGKTLLARIVYYANALYHYSPGFEQSLYGHVPGKFFEARELMALFDQDYDPYQVFREFRQLVVVDDVGREGTLRWEKRDLAMQLEEKQARYYNVIDHCYRNKISVVITSNLGSRELAAFLGGASWSRLLEMCPKQFRVNMSGLPDMRPDLAEEW